MSATTLSLFDQPVSGDRHPLPDRIPCISLWEPYASLVLAGVKTIETRTWPWPYEPGWLAIHRAKHVDKEAMLRLQGRLASAGLTEQAIREGLGSVGGIVYVTGSRPLLTDDEHAACFYAPDRFAWPLEHATRLKAPIVMRGPQKFVYLPRKVVEDALGARAD